MGVGEALPGLVGEVPQAHRATTAAGLVTKPHPALGPRAIRCWRAPWTSSLQLVAEFGGALGPRVFSR